MLLNTNTFNIVNEYHFEKLVNLRRDRLNETI